MKILVGLSGGADSAAVALRLKREGHEVTGAFLKLFDAADDAPARFAADKLGIGLCVVDRREAFEKTVIADFVREYACGRTPNPCALCNREIKIRFLIGAADRMGCEKVATGHYARLGEAEGRHFVAAGADESRDQSYFLWRLTGEELSRLIFPLGEAKKRELMPEVRDLLPEGTHESREVCFIPGDDHAAFLAGHFPEHFGEGDFADAAGKALGHHAGYWRYTVGQRRGLGMGFGKRMYVTGVDAASARVTLGEKADCEAPGALLGDFTFQKWAPFCGERAVFCRARYRAPLLPARLCVSEDGTGSITLADSRRAVFAPGQSVVCYDEAGAILCGGVIGTRKA